MNKYREIFNSTQEEIDSKYSWLKEAKFYDAVIEDMGDYIIWYDGVWKNGIWKNGIWEYGVWKGGAWEGGFWKDGTWKDGVWKSGAWEDGVWYDGIWKDGKMWSNIDKKYIEIVQKDGKFIKKQL